MVVVGVVELGFGVEVGELEVGLEVLVLVALEVLFEVEVDLIELVVVTLMVLVLVLHVGAMCFLVHDDDFVNVKVDVWPFEVDLLVQLHDVIVVFHAVVIVATAGAGLAYDDWKRRIKARSPDGRNIFDRGKSLSQLPRKVEMR